MWTENEDYKGFAALLLFSSFHLLPPARGRKEKGVLTFPSFWFMGPVSWFSISWMRLERTWLLIQASASTEMEEK